MPNKVELSVFVTVEQPNVSRILFVQTMGDETAQGHTEACAIYKAADGKYYLEGIYQITKNEEHSDTDGARVIYYGAMRI